MGIVLRSLLMDSLLTQYLRYFTLEVTELNYDHTLQQLQNESLKLIADGTAHIIQDFLLNDRITVEERKQIAHKIANLFPGIFNIDPHTGMPKLDKKYRVSLAEMHEKGKHKN